MIFHEEKKLCGTSKTVPFCLRDSDVSLITQCLLTRICNDCDKQKYPVFASVRGMNEDVPAHDVIMQRCLQQQECTNYN